MRYPSAGARITARDSNFIFGSLGNGRASLAINGAPVPVLPNGSWIAFLPVPGDGRYEIVAALGRDTARVTHTVRTLPPRPVLASTGPLVVDSQSLTPGGALALRADEMVRVSVRAPANAAAWVVTGAAGADSARRALVNDAARPGAPLAGEGDGAVQPRFLGDSLLWATDVPAG
ncbi:MAG TPA: hypothetical protein VFS05_01110, partial [Gemmatimonadaceae bacterium]|nr:hypothetical protein [Gemmatimonadaceae bacterium]